MDGFSDGTPLPSSDIEGDGTSPVSPVSPLPPAADDSDEGQSDEEETHNGEDVDDVDDEVERDEVEVMDEGDEEERDEAEVMDEGDEQERGEAEVMDEDDEQERAEVEGMESNNNDTSDQRDDDDIEMIMSSGSFPSLTQSSDSAQPYIPRRHIPLSRVPTNSTGISKMSFSSLGRRLILRHRSSTVTREYDALPVPRERPHIYLFELVVLACRLHKSQGLYRIFSRNCYWFVGMIFHVLRKFTSSNARLIDDAGGEKELEPSDEIHPLINGGRMGTFMSAITIVKAPRMFTVDAMIRRWQGAVVRFHDQASHEFM